MNSLHDTQPTDHAGAQTEMVHGYKILEATLFVNDRGFALAENLGAPSPYVTWQFTVENNKPDYYWGHYISDADRARQDYQARVQDYRDSYHLAEKSPIATVEMSTEQNYNQIDGQRNNLAVPRPDLTDGQTHGPGHPLLPLWGNSPCDELRELAPEALPVAKASVLGKIREAQATPCAHSQTKCKEELER